MTQTGAEPTASEIRRVALQMFADRGYDGASIRDIATAVGIRGASMYNHFRSKEEILWALTVAAFEALHAGWREEREALGDTHPLGLLAGFVRAHVRYHAEKHLEAAIINAQLTKLNPDHYAKALSLRRDYERILTGLVQDCLATGEHEAPDVRITVFAILQMATAVSTWYRPSGPLDVNELCEVYACLAVKMLAPLRPPTS